ncbi:MAG TPA: cupredoxin domain-containing protein [Anaerolineales bacterium]|nr:cupredoxin domain-containing protein [Anaerolineales bacterium]
MKIQAFLIAIAFVFLSLTSCSGAGSETIHVSMRDFSFTPDRFTVRAGTTVTLTIRNLGALDHNFHIMDLGYFVEGPWSGTDETGVYQSHSDLPGGEVSTTSFIAPNTPGEYQILCSIPSHLELGMQATLTVTE